MKKILIVDDDPTNLVMAKNALDDLYKVIAVSSGVQAIAYLENNMCDMILLDVEMPVMDGIETLKQIRTMPNGEHTPTLFLTANQYRETVLEGAKLGILDYITKPINAWELRQRIEEVFRKLFVFTEEDELYGLLTDALRNIENGDYMPASTKIREAMERLNYR